MKLVVQKHRKGVPTPILAEEYLAGATSTQLAAKYEMSPAAICSRLGRAGVKIRPARRRVVEDNKMLPAEIVSDYIRGVPVQEIAKSRGVGRNSIVRVLKNSKVKLCKFHRQTITIPSSELAVAYLAGLFDGEGNINLKGGIRPRITIYNTSPDMMRWIHSTFGGSLRYDTRRVITKGWKPIGVWSLYRSRDVAAILRAMMPYLTAKKRAAKVILDQLESDVQIHDSPPTITQSILPAPKFVPKSTGPNAGS